MIAKVEPLTSARALRGPFDYVLNGAMSAIGVGSVVMVGPPWSAYQPPPGESTLLSSLLVTRAFSFGIRFAGRRHRGEHHVQDSQ